MADAMRTLADAELEIMQAIWACEEPVKRAAISAILDRTHPMAPTTLLTVLSRLADKGFVRIEKTGRSAEYRPLVAKEDYLARQGRKFYDKLCSGSVSAFAAALSASGLTAIISVDSAAERLISRRAWASSTGCTSCAYRLTTSRSFCVSWIEAYQRCSAGCD